MDTSLAGEACSTSQGVALDTRRSTQAPLEELPLVDTSLVGDICSATQGAIDKPSSHSAPSTQSHVAHTPSSQQLPTTHSHAACSSKAQAHAAALKENLEYCREWVASQNAEKQHQVKDRRRLSKVLRKLNSK